jgi:hypothetical protein
MAQSRPELELVLELQDVVQGHPPRTGSWRDNKSGLAADLTSGKSGNWKPLGCAVALYQVGQGEIESPEARRLIREWIDYYAASGDAFMGDEFGSRIYGPWHLMSNLAVAAWTEKTFPHDTSALDWLAAWWHLCKDLRTPDGQVLMIGQRSGGHPTVPGWFEYLLARASGNGLARAEAWGAAAGLGIKKSWMFQVLEVLQETLSRSYRRAMSAPAPPIGLRRPLTIIRTDTGMATYLGNDPARGLAWSNDNANTTPVVGATWQGGTAKYLPDNGGPRVRERFDHCTVVERGGNLVYDSDISGHQELPIPGREIERTVRYLKPLAA